MRYSIVSTISIDAPSREAAETAAKQVHAGIWDLMPQLPAPAITVLLFDGETLLRKIYASGELRGGR
jgi:hypothetical protein